MTTKPPNTSTPAAAYYRTSSATNVGQDKDSLRRQQEAVTGFAKRARMTVAQEFYDAAVSGADPIDTRAGFTALLRWCDENACKVILVEGASRFARDLAVQLAGRELLRQRGIELYRWMRRPTSPTLRQPPRWFARSLVPSASLRRHRWWPSCGPLGSASASLPANARGRKDSPRRTPSWSGGQEIGPQIA